MNEDLLELLGCLKFREVEFLVIGAHAVGFFARPRMTQDLDLWIGRSVENVARLCAALDDFGVPIGEAGAKRFSELDRQMVRIGAPPNMVDIHNFATGGSFDEVYSRRVYGNLGAVEVAFPCKEDLFMLKHAVGRPQDIADIERLKLSESDS